MSQLDHSGANDKFWTTMTPLTETVIGCPYCGEAINVLIDPEEAGQQYIEDCQVCCRPIVFNLHVDSMGEINMSVHDENEA